MMPLHWRPSRRGLRLPLGAYCGSSRPYALRSQSRQVAIRRHLRLAEQAVELIKARFPVPRCRMQDLLTAMTMRVSGLPVAKGYLAIEAHQGYCDAPLCIPGKSNGDRV